MNVSDLPPKGNRGRDYYFFSSGLALLIGILASDHLVHMLPGRLSGFLLSPFFVISLLFVSCLFLLMPLFKWVISKTNIIFALLGSLFAVCLIVFFAYFYFLKNYHAFLEDRALLYAVGLPKDLIEKIRYLDELHFSANIRDAEWLSDSKLQSLSISSNNYFDLNSLPVSLTKLNLDKVNLDSLRDVSHLKNLSELTIQRSSAERLSIPSSLEKLEKLTVINCPNLVSLGISQLSLRELRLEDLPSLDLSDFKYPSSLEALSFVGSFLDQSLDVSKFSGMRSLKSLRLSSLIYQIDSLPVLDSLIFLEIEHFSSDLGFESISRQVNLNRLDLAGTGVLDLSLIHDSLPLLSHLGLRGFTSIQGMESISPYLDTLEISYVDELELNQLPNLTHLSQLILRHNLGLKTLESISSKTPNIRKLSLEGNLNLANYYYIDDLKFLYSLHISNSDLKNLTFLRNSNISELILQNLYSLTNLFGLETVPESSRGFSFSVENAPLLVDLSALLLRDDIVNLTLVNVPQYQGLFENWANSFSLDSVTLSHYASTNFSSLSSADQISYLKIINPKRLTSLKGLSNFSGLKTLILEDAQLTTLTEISEFRHLYRLELVGLPLVALSELPDSVRILHITPRGVRSPRP